MLSLALALTLAAAPAPVWTTVTKDQGFVGFDGEYPFSETTIEVGPAKLRLLITAGDLPVGRDAVRSWIATNAAALAQYYGAFPAEAATITVLTGEHGRVFGGTAFGGRVVRIHVGREATAETLARDWRLPHELLHLAFADLGDAYLYLEEGLATYVEPVYRAQAGLLTEEKLWADLVDGMPNGASGQPMDALSSWGNTYWGGARFWLLADVAIREQTGGKKSLQDALKHIHAKGGNGRVHLALDQMLKLGDEGTGTTALRDLHERLGKKGEPANLDALWKKLGIAKKGDQVVLADNPLRKAITRPR